MYACTCVWACVVCVCTCVKRENTHVGKVKLMFTLFGVYCGKRGRLWENPQRYSVDVGPWVLRRQKTHPNAGKFLCSDMPMFTHLCQCECVLSGLIVCKCVLSGVCMYVECWKLWVLNVIYTCVKWNSFVFAEYLCDQQRRMQLNTSTNTTRHIYIYAIY